MKRLLLSFKVLLATMLLFAGGNAWAAEVTFIAGTDTTSSSAAGEEVLTKDGVTITISKGMMYTTPYRLYKGETITVSSTVGNITSTVFNVASGYAASNLTDATEGTYDSETATWTGDAASFTLTASVAQTRFTSITVTTSDAAAAVKTPVASLENGTYFGTQSVELTCETEGATIYYTTDGTEPTAESTAYTAAIEISETTTLKAIAISGEDKSSVVTRTYTIGASYANIAALVAGAQSGDQAQLTLTDAVVTYVNGSDVYVQDATGALDFYTVTKIGETELAAGSVINGTAVVKYTLYKSILPEITSLEGDVTVTAGEAPAATAMSVADALKAENLNKYITISPATVTEAGIVSGTDTLAIYDKWKTGATPAAGLYDQVTGVVSAYNQIQLNFISADTTKLATVEEGVYYLQNVATKQYFCGANSWGTHASLNASGIDVTLARLADGTYTIDTKLSNGGNNHYLTDVWCDGAATGHGLYAVEGAENTYYIAIAGGYLAYDGSTTSLVASETQDENAQWVLKTKEDRLAEMAQATQDAPVIATFLIEDPNFGRNDQRQSAWTSTSVTIGTSDGDTGKQYGNNNAESYHKTFSIWQQIGLPAGVYSLTAQGFYREDTNAGTTVDLPVFYIGDETAQFPLKTGTENSMYQAAVSFSAGSYTIDPIYVKVEGDSVALGARLESSTNLWCIWDNFQLTYYGPDANIDQLKNAALYDQLAALLEEAKTLAADETLHAAKAKALATAIAAGEAAQEGSDLEAVSAAIEALTAANKEAAAYQKAADVLAQMKKLTESTNFYTEEALNEYYTQWQAKYDEGTLTSEEASGLQNPYTQTDWHAALTCDNFLMSAWDQPADFGGFYYINTWSVEGNTDGSEFKTPFFEYWTGDAGTLGANTLSATVSNLAPGEYTVEAVVRVRLSNSATGAAPSGITMQANDGEAVSVCDGTAYGQLYVDTVTVACTVGEDSVLTVKFNVEDGTNVSWLSFQNVKYIAPATELEIPVSAERYEGLGYEEQTIDIDLDAAMEFLGITDISEATDIAINMSNDSIITDAMAKYDGWLNKQGDFAAYGNASYAYAKFNPLHKEYSYSGDDILFGAWPYDGAPVAGDSFTFKYGLQANGKTVIYVVTVNFIEQPVVKYDIIKTITVPVMLQEKASYNDGVSTTASFDVDEVLEALGATDIATCERYLVNVSDSSFVTETTDGWRDANGDMAGWGTTAGVCVQMRDEYLPEGTFNFIGCIDQSHEAGEVYHALVGFVYNEKAVLVDVVVTFATAEAVGIQSLTNGQSLENATIYTLGGQRVSNVSKGGIYIVNGKKVFVK